MKFFKIKQKCQQASQRFTAKGVMFGLEGRALKKQSGELFLASLRRLSFRLVEGQQASQRFTAKGVMFGLDARIALAVLAIVSLSIAFVQEKKTTKNRVSIAKQEMAIFKAKFLKNWQKLRFDGYYTTPSDVTSRTLTSSPFPPGYGKGDYVFRHEPAAPYSNFFANIGTYTHPYNSQTYNYSSQAFALTSGSLNDNRVVMYHNYKNAYFDVSANKYFDYLRKDLGYRLVKVFEKVISQEGLGSIEVSSTFHDANFTNSKLISLSSKRSALNRISQPYFIIEYNVNMYSPSEYIVHVVNYSAGSNGVVDSTLPKTLLELKNFTAQGDDLVDIFSTKEVYLKAKVENQKRLNIVKNELSAIAEINYIDRHSLCAAESTPTASCDLDTDGDFDTDDKNLLVDYNPYVKSSLDSSSAKYYETSTAFNSHSMTATDDLLMDRLNIPGYYSIGLFGNKMMYDSNVDNVTSAPYTMEVWY